MATTHAISIRVSDRDRALIDKAAEAQNKSRTQFMLDSARSAAKDALLARQHFFLSKPEFEEFEHALEAAPTLDNVQAAISRRPKPWP